MKYKCKDYCNSEAIFTATANHLLTKLFKFKVKKILVLTA